MLASLMAAAVHVPSAAEVAAGAGYDARVAYFPSRGWEGMGCVMLRSPGTRQRRRRKAARRAG